MTAGIPTGLLVGAISADPSFFQSVSQVPGLTVRQMGMCIHWSLRVYVHVRVCDFAVDIPSCVALLCAQLSLSHSHSCTGVLLSLSQRSGHCTANCVYIAISGLDRVSGLVLLLSRWFEDAEDRLEQACPDDALTEAGAASGCGTDRGDTGAEALARAE